MYTTLHFRNYKATIVLSWIRVCFCARFVCFFFNESASRLMKRFNKIKQKKFHKNEYRWVTFDALNSQCQYFKEVFQILILINRRYQKMSKKLETHFQPGGKRRIWINLKILYILWHSDVLLHIYWHWYFRHLQSSF